MLNELKKYENANFKNEGDFFGIEAAEWTYAEIVEYLNGCNDISELSIGTDRYGDFGILNKMGGMEMIIED